MSDIQFTESVRGEACVPMAISASASGVGNSDTQRAGPFVQLPPYSLRLTPITEAGTTGVPHP
jgi:hypothetical protein